MTKIFCILALSAFGLAACGTLNIQVQPAGATTQAWGLVTEEKETPTIETALPLATATPDLPSLSGLPPVVDGAVIHPAGSGPAWLAPGAWPSVNTFQDPGCGVQFDYPADWAVESVPDALCLFGLRPPDWENFLAQATTDEEAYPIYVTFSTNDWLLAASRAGFVQQAGAPGLVGHQGVVTQAWFGQAGGRLVLFGETPRGIYAKEGGPLTNTAMARAAVAPLDATSSIFVRSAYAMPVYWPAFQVALTSARRLPQTTPVMINWRSQEYLGVLSFSYPLELYSVLDRPSSTDALWPGVIEILPNDAFNQVLNQPATATWRIRVAIRENTLEQWNMDDHRQLLSGGGILATYAPDILDTSYPIIPYTVGGLPAWRVDHLPVGDVGDMTHIITIYDDKIFEWVIEPQQLGSDLRNWHYVEDILSTFALK